MSRPPRASSRHSSSPPVNSKAAVRCGEAPDATATPLPRQGSEEIAACHQPMKSPGKSSSTGAKSNDTPSPVRRNECA